MIKFRQLVADKIDIFVDETLFVMKSRTDPLIKKNKIKQQIQSYRSGIAEQYNSLFLHFEHFRREK